MAILALNGGSPVCRGKAWPKWPVHDQREIDLICEVTRSGNWSYEGPKETEFCEKFAAFNNAAYALAVANGTIALQLALEALGREAATARGFAGVRTVGARPRGTRARAIDGPRRGA